MTVPVNCSVSSGSSSPVAEPVEATGQLSRTPKEQSKFLTELNAEFCEYGGTQTRLENDERPADMPPMVPGAIGGIRPCPTMA